MVFHSEAIPILTEENFSSWQTQITDLFKLEDNDNATLCAIILSKLLTGTQNNVVTSEKEDQAQILWKAILKRFISSEPSNQARVYSYFLNITFNISNIEKFIMEVRSSIVKMEDVGIKIPEEIITYDLLKRLPSSLENINQSITHSKNGEEIKPEILLDHLEIHINELNISAASKAETVTTMYTRKDQKCSGGVYNPNSKTHTKDKCWAMYPEKRLAFLKKKEESQVSSFSTYSSTSQVTTPVKRPGMIQPSSYSRCSIAQP
ncbi:hypothetical protein VP01_8772g1, partial [Puccinia sorghi]